MGRLVTALIRLALRLKNRLQAHPGIGRIYQRVSLEVQNRQLFTPLVAHEWMLADRTRVDAYHRAINRHVHPGDTVLDLGTGSGILSFLAARRNPKKVWAVDHADVIDMARLVAERNAFHSIEFVKIHSRDLRLPERVDVLIHEQIGVYVFDEGLVASVVDARDRLLKPSGRILPARFDVFLEPAKVRDEHRVPFIWEQRVYDVDFSCLREWAERAPDGALASIWPQHIDFHLCAPESVMTFDLRTVREDDLPHTLSFVRPVARSGRLDGLCLYFRARFDDEISLGNAPGDGTTSWQIPFLRVPMRECRLGEAIEFQLRMGDLVAPWTWRWSCVVR